MSSPAKPPSSTAPRENRPLYAIGLRLIAVLCMSIMFITVRLASEHGVHVLESLFYRQALALPLVFGWIVYSSGIGGVRTSRMGAHATRMMLGLTGMVLNFLSYILLPPAEATTIGFTMPIFGTIMSALILREKTGVWRWGAVLVGFVGVIIMLRPTGGIDAPITGVMIAVSGAIITAIISLVLRALSRAEPAGVIVFWFTLLSMPPLGIAMLFVGQAHDLTTWGLLMVIGIVGGIAQLCMTGALRWAPVSVVLPMDYSTILWTTLFGLALWGDWPTSTTWIGAGLIVTSGLTIAWREHVLGRRARLAQ